MNLIELFQFPLGVVANDAGGANQILALLNNVPNQDCLFFMEGPASKIYVDKFGLDKRLKESLVDVVKNSKMLLTGTGWASSLEHSARKMASVSGLKSVALLDHWVNYADRFERFGEKILPDEIWVTDGYAKSIAKAEFPNTIIIEVPSYYLNDLVEAIKTKEDGRRPSKRLHILYVLEPIRVIWGSEGKLGEFESLDYFMGKVKLLAPDVGCEIQLRPHPSDPPEKYSNWIISQACADLAIDQSLDLSAAIAWSDVVIGCNTYALVVALAAGKKVISSVPPWVGRCSLPQKEIISLSDL